MRRSSPRGILRRDLDRLLDAGPGVLLQRVQLQPAFGAGRRFVGFEIVSVFENQPAALRYGVRPGDLVLRVNGQQLLTPAHLVEVFRLLRNASQLEVELVRRGKPLTVRVPIIDPEPTTGRATPVSEVAPRSSAKTCSRSSNMDTLLR